MTLKAVSPTMFVNKGPTRRPEPLGARYAIAFTTHPHLPQSQLEHFTASR